MTLKSLAHRDPIHSVTIGRHSIKRTRPAAYGGTGDSNGQGWDEPTIGDVSALLDALFISALFIQGDVEPIVACVQEADNNQSGGTVS